MDAFEVLGLPRHRVEKEDLEAAYRLQRRRWFVKQFQPQTVATAQDRMREIDRAYRLLLDSREQQRLLSTMIAVRMEGPAPPKSALPVEPTLDRGQAVRQLLRTAEEKKRLAGRWESRIGDELFEQGVRLGLAHADLRDVVRRIGQQLQD